MKHLFSYKGKVVFFFLIQKKLWAFFEIAAEHAASKKEVNNASIWGRGGFPSP